MGSLRSLHKASREIIVEWTDDKYRITMSWQVLSQHRPMLLMIDSYYKCRDWMIDFYVTDIISSQVIHGSEYKTTLNNYDSAQSFLREWHTKLKDGQSWYSVINFPNKWDAHLGSSKNVTSRHDVLMLLRRYGG
jgi:hypothetical protein